jgi:hypothetical protein
MEKSSIAERFLPWDGPRFASEITEFADGVAGRLGREWNRATTGQDPEAASSLVGRKGGGVGVR